MDDITVQSVNGTTEDEKPTDIDRLVNIVNKLEEDNDLPSPKASEKQLQNGHVCNRSDVDSYSLENTSIVLDGDFDSNVDSEDSWLYESPQKMKTPGKGISSPDKWLIENITTPELMRVRGSLSAKLDVINYEKRKGRFTNTDPHRRKTSQIRKESMNSVHSLDWEYDEENSRSHAPNRNQITNDDFHEDDYSYDEEFDAESELISVSNHAQQPTAASHIDRHAWSEPPPARHGNNDNIARPFSLDWSDEEDELVPMKINFNSPPQRQVQPRSMIGGQNGAIVRRGVSGIDNLATPRQPENYDYDDFVARPTGTVKPRRAVVPTSDSNDSFDEPDNSFDDFDDSAPVVPRGAVKRVKSSSSGVKRTSFAENVLVHPIGVNDYGVRVNQAAQLLKKTKNSPTPRAAPGIGKPVQRRTKPAEAPVSGIRPRGSANNLLKPRTSGNVQKSHSVPDMGDQSLVARLPTGGDGPVLRRRGAGDSNNGNGGMPAPRKSKESPQIARVQGIPQVRRSTGSIPQKSDGLPRPRRSASPSGIVRPRGSGLSQSVQANY